MDEPGENPQIFLSYSRKDWDDFAEPLYIRLTQEGFRVWVDQHLLRPSDDWMDSINEALDACEVLILCVSPSALASRYVKMEYREFFHDGKRIIPVVCRQGTRLPAELRGIQHHPFDVEEVTKLTRDILLSK